MALSTQSMQAEGARARELQCQSVPGQTNYSPALSHLPVREGTSLPPAEKYPVVQDSQAACGVGGG